MIVEINTQSALPIYEQLRDQIVMGIAAKQIAPGEALPSVRNLAADLGINFHTVNKAYTMLCDEGYIAMDRRKGAVVARPVTGGETFSSYLTQKLSLAAAEAICHDMSESGFLELCAECYKSAKGDDQKGETT